MGFRASSVALSMLAAVLAAGVCEQAVAAESAVIIMYHRFGDSRYPSTNTTLEQLDADIKELKSGPYHVLPVPEIMAAIESGKPLPEHTVGITIDDAYETVYTNGWPRFKAAGLPITLFLSTDSVDLTTAGKWHEYMTWDQVREMKAAGVTIGHHSAAHAHMAAQDPAANRRDIAKASARFKAEIGSVPTLFAYPYGEASLALEKVLKEAGFTTAFGQQSGAIGPDTNPMYLPRFALNEHYGDIDRFKLVVNTLPLPVGDVTPVDPMIGANNPPAIGFTVKGDVKGLDRMTCFVSPNKVNIERLGESRFEVRVDTPFPKGRTRLNCTLPGPGGRWYWYGRQFFEPK